MRDLNLYLKFRLATHGRTIHRVRSGKVLIEQIISALPSVSSMTGKIGYSRSGPYVDGSGFGKVYLHVCVTVGAAIRPAC